MNYRLCIFYSIFSIFKNLIFKGIDVSIFLFLLNKNKNFQRHFVYVYYQLILNNILFFF